MKATNLTSPISYLLIGSGRVARHLAHYFHLLNISYDSWDRSQDPHALARKISRASHALLAISDSALEGFYRQHLAGHDITVVQFSGAHHFQGMISAHPLMTFGPELYDLDFYRKIHFTLTGASSLQDALPGLDNSSSEIRPADKAHYHAACVMGGNFVSLLIRNMLQDFAAWKIPPEAAELYVHQVLKNTFQNPDKALTGPLARKDVNTVQANLKALENDPAAEIYQAFLKTYWPEYPRK